MVPFFLFIVIIGEKNRKMFFDFLSSGEKQFFPIFSCARLRKFLGIWAVCEFSAEIDRESTSDNSTPSGEG